jgi:3-hydroxyacyl-CoA dehydrogenase/enoyl-CoA hydratase/3-hydroxybutyryl-CoA epimerase/3-hydroxyacyl-CoA dehydrogenase/enoyl-CoA hydratase/3-hydroxybutyryl-CoA epimerase/enoyl-CoA isomerase
MSTNALRWEVENDVAVITLDQPGSRANVMSAAVLAEFEKVLGEVEARKGLRGLVLRSAKPGMFIAGADLKELGSPQQTPELVRQIMSRGLGVIRRIESLPYPTVALIDGPALGGGLEVALGFDYRLASTNPKTELGLPETKVGLIPGWGGTQRLPRIIGPALAVEAICSGEPFKAARAVEVGLAFDAVATDKLMSEGLRLIEQATKSGEPARIRKQKQQPIGLTEEQITYTIAVAKGQVLAKTKGQYPAPLAALDVIAKTVNLPLDEGLAIESAAFGKLIGSEVSRSLIAVFFMNTRIQKDTGVSDANIAPKEIKAVGVIGAGLMGAGIAGAFIRRGVPAMMSDVAPAALEKGGAAIQKVMQDRVMIGRMKIEEVAAALGKLSTTMTLNAFADRDLVVEAVIENEAEKVKLYQEVQKVIAPAAILASNTSTISITRMAKSVQNPERFAGMHFFNPVDRMQLVEVIRGEKTSDQTVATLVAAAKRIGKSPIVVKDCPGFLVNRILFPYLNEALVLLEEGADPRATDKAALAFGMPMGPITLQDVVGLDTSLYAGSVIERAFPDRAAKSSIVGLLVKAGRLGQKSGAGFYSYAKDPKKGADDPALAGFLEKCRKGKRDFTLEEITDRLFLPMYAEATRVLAEGIVRDPADVDMGLILGIGFPPYRGGILRWADSVGRDKIKEKLKKYEALGERFKAVST